jgi:hypothetical protein
MPSSSRQVVEPLPIRTLLFDALVILGCVTFWGADLAFLGWVVWWAFHFLGRWGTTPH